MACAGLRRGVRAAFLAVLLRMGAAQRLPAAAGFAAAFLSLVPSSAYVPAAVTCQGPAETCNARPARASAVHGKDHQLLQWQTVMGSSAPQPPAPSLLTTAASGDAFSPADGGTGRACRGANVNDNAASNYVAHWRSMTLEACQALCVGTPGCRGVEHSSAKCEVWTRVIQATASSSGFQCLHYDPFVAVDGGTERACRGDDAQDSSEEYYVGPVAAASLSACMDRCAGLPGCKGVEFGGGQCELWIHSIRASAPVPGRSCLRYEPFAAVDGGSGRACRGADAGDSFPHYYYTLQVSSLESCKSACAGDSNCKGVEYQQGRCEIWTRPGGVAASAPLAGAVCLRFGAADPAETGDAFAPAGGGADRGCRGANINDNLESYYHTHAGVTSLEDCKAICVGTSGCKGVEFSSTKCEVWTRAIEATVSSTGFQCHRYEPFAPVQGGEDRACRGSTSSDVSSSYYTSYSLSVAGTLEACKSLCVNSHECKGVEFSGVDCKVWTRPAGIGAAAKASGSRCLRYEPFQAAEGGRDRACRGADLGDTWPSYYTLFSLSQVASLEACKARCMETSGCKGVQFSSSGCQVWTRPRGIGSTAPAAGSSCLRFGPSEIAAAADAFLPVDGGASRACPGASAADGGAEHYVAVGPGKAASLEACKGLCVATPGCTGIDYGAEDCKLWTRPEGVGATAAASGRQCLRYEPLEGVDGGEDRACRGATTSDNSGSYYTVHSAASLLACRMHCAEDPNCKGVEYSGGRCEVWTRSAGIQASSAATGFQCHRYQPFVLLGGEGQACRGASPSDESTSYYTLHGPSAVASLDACKALCVGTDGCKGVDYGSAGCKVWTRSIGATAAAAGGLCLRLGPPEPSEGADAFAPADGAIDRACRGGSATDNSAAHFTVYGPSVASSLEECKALCVGTVGCKGVEFSSGKCEVWTRAGGIGATVSSPGYQCYHYEPFTLVDGFTDRACRGSSASDNSPSYYSSQQASSLDACKALCITTYGCKGVEYRSGVCEVWTRLGGIQASAPASGVTCLLYEPFTSAGAGQDRACRGQNSEDNWPSYYRLYGKDAAPSLEACKALCVGASDCKGVEYGAGRCELWTRRAGIGTTVQASGSVCLRLGLHDPLATASAFSPVDGGEGRSCSGASSTDVSSSYYTAIGPALATSLEACMGLCVAEPACKGVDYSSAEGCRVWTRAAGVGSTAALAGHTCLRYEPFVPADGATDRACRGAASTDNSASYYTLVSSSVAGSMESCKALCVATAGCKGVEFSSRGCEVWTRTQGIGATAPAPGYRCLRYEPFAPVGGGSGQACRGTHPTDDSSSHYQLYPSATSVEACKALCLGRPDCRGIDLGAAGCKVWTRAVGATAPSSGSLCLRFGAAEPGEAADAFVPVDGAMNRACRGATSSDNSPAYFTEYSPADAPSLDACKALCISTTGCTAMEFSSSKCEVWTRGLGAGATVAAPGYQCYNYAPFTPIGGFSDRACRGASPTDDSASYKSVQRVASLSACKALCVDMPGCKGIEFSAAGDCEVWTREGGIQASVAAAGYQCLIYEPFSNADGGKDRACRGADSNDNWPSHYELRSADSLAACKSLCAGAAGCKGLEYADGRCELWTRRRGIGSTAEKAGAVCLRYGHHDAMELASAFTPVDRGTDRACRGASASDDSTSYYKSIGPAKATSQEACMALCIATPNCQGIDYSSQGCKIWTRGAGIGATVGMSGHTCLRYEPFTPADGGEDRACRGADAGDNLASHHFVSSSGSASMTACREACAATPGCKGVEYSRGRCEVWTRTEGIGATVSSSGFTCLRYEPFTLVDGGRDRSCRGGSITDNSTSHYDFYGGAQAASLEACKALCMARPGCKGLEYSTGSCKVWTRPAGIGMTAAASGSLCLRYGAEAAGLEETWPRRGDVRPLALPGKCLEAAGGLAHNGNNLQLADCAAGSAGQQFSLAGDGTGHVLWGGKCLDVSSGRNVNGNNVQLWDCEDPPSRNMQFVLPASGVGPIRWASNPDKCLDVSAGNVQIWSCEDASRPITQWLLPPGGSYQLRATKYVTHYMPWFLGAHADAACARRPDTCAYRDDHWCSSYGNSFYASNKGAYDITQQGIIDQQLDEMKDAGLDGLWIDYQSANWDGVVNQLIAGAKARGMGFAVVVDDTINADIMERSRTEIAAWVQEPHYFRHQGFPIVPVFNSDATVFASMPFTAIFLSRAELAKPSWAADTYTWVHGDDGFLSNYYKQEHPVFLSGSAYRGYRDCYLGKSLGFPHIGMLGPSLQLAGERKPAFVQLNTWNDYTEGTMLEPSWLREEDTCVDVCSPTYNGQACLTTSVCGSHDAFTDCSKPVGRALGPGPASCGATGDLSARAELDQIKSHVLAERAAEGAFTAGR